MRLGRGLGENCDAIQLRISSSAMCSCVAVSTLSHLERRFCFWRRDKALEHGLEVSLLNTYIILKILETSAVRLLCFNQSFDDC